MNVGKNFIKWFEYGFVIMIIMFSAILVLTLSYACKSGSGLGLGACLLSIVICGFIGLMIAGSVFRWSEAGRTCSGGAAPSAIPVGTIPYMIESGECIWYFLIISYIIVGLFFVCAVVGSFCCSSSKQTE